MAEHLLTVADLTAGDIDELMRLTDVFAEVSRRPIPKVPALRGKNVVWLFYEDSTGTRLSFEQAAKRLSADTMTFSVGSSSVSKGESLRDTVLTIEAMGVDAIVVRHRSAGVPWQVAGWLEDRVSVVNAGDGWHEHPTQALLDCYTLREHLGGLEGRRIAIVGDVKHSRVARSDVIAFTTLGAEVVLVAPPTLLPPNLDGWPVRIEHDLDAVLPDVDAVYLLRMQRERMTEHLVPSLREYTARYGLTTRRVDAMRAEALVLHPGPMNRGVEISAEVADLPRSVIIDQVRNGVAVRMAVLYLLLGSGVDKVLGTDVDPVQILAAETEGSGALMETVIKGGLVVDATGEQEADVVIGEDGTIVAVGSDLSAERTIDATDCIVGPGLVDLHTHLRQPGQEEAETIETGARAAALGGYTCILAMPNTIPAIDHAGVVREVLELGSKAPCDVQTSGAITVGRAGEQLAPLGEMADLGVRFFTDDGAGVADTRLMRRALEYAGSLRAAGQPVVLAQHCEDPALSAGGHMHEGEWSSRLGIPGQPAEAEELMVLRDLALARLTGTRVHFQHLSTARSIQMVRDAKATGLPVSCEATTHHFTLTHAACAGYDPVFKVNPPLRTDADVDAVRSGLRDGTIDCIATDHAPHTQEAKEAPFDQAPPGMLGLETALALALTELDLEIAEVLALLSWRPAQILGLDDEHGGPIVAGRPANLVVFDPNREWVVEPAELASRSRNTPYAGRLVRGKVRHTVLWGEPVVLDGEAQR